MRKYRVLILTDHTHHTAENSVYAFGREMLNHPMCTQLDIASRGNPANKAFFEALDASTLSVMRVDSQFSFSVQGHSLMDNLVQEDPEKYDLIWLRLPPSRDERFLRFLGKSIRKPFIINDPEGILITGSKLFLLRYPELCAPMTVCHSVEDIESFRRRFPIVLKPFNEYGGKGIVRIIGNAVSTEGKETSFDEFISTLKEGDINYLGVKYLKNVSEGDKRIVVVNGQIMGASLRLPAEGSWLCNVSMGGSSHLADVTPEEIDIVHTIQPDLADLGIVMYGVDTLVDDTGKRILSEINTNSIGGLPQIAAFTDTPLVKQAVNLIWDYFITRKSQEYE